MMVIIVSGLVAAFNMRTQIFPDVEADTVTVTIPFPGASPGEIENGVLLRVEDAVRDIQGISRMTSDANQGVGRVSLDVDSDSDIQVIIEEVNMAMSGISSMPSQTEHYSVVRSAKKSEAITVQVTGNISERSMKSLAEQVRNEILALPSVTSAELKGARDYEIGIELEEGKLRQYDLTLDSVARAIRLSSLDLAAGSISTDAGDIMLRTQGQAYTQSDFENIVLLTEVDGTRLTLGDIAQVNDGFVEQHFFSFFNNEPSIGISVYAVGEQNQIQISKEVKTYVEQRGKTLPEGISIAVWADTTSFLNETLSIMLSNIMFGVILVMTVLGIFLRMQLAFWVMLGMPIAFLGAFALMPAAGASINMLSLFGFILVLGIVVDDAIIIGESVQTHVERDGHKINSVIIGARQVAVPATFGVLTTVATFVPFLSVPGSFGAIPAAIGWVVILCLIFSIVESKLILPAHLASMKPPKPSNSPIRRLQDLSAKQLQNIKLKIYTPLLEKALAARYTTTAIFLGMLLLALGFVAGPYIKTTMFPPMTSQYISAQVELVSGASSAQLNQVVQLISDKLIELNDSKPESERFLKNVAATTSPSQGGDINADLETVGDVDPERIAREWRDLVGDLVGTKRLEFSGTTASHGGSGDVGFSLVGSDPHELRAAAELLGDTLRNFAGVSEIISTAQGSIPEINLVIKPSAEALGLTLNDLANQVRAAFYGVEAQRIQRGQEEVKVMVRYPKSERESLGNLENMYIRTPSGDEVPFSAVAEIEERMSPARIYREWGKRTVFVSAVVDNSQIEPGAIVRSIMQGDLQRRVQETYPTVQLEIGGASLEEERVLRRLMITAALGLFAIYALMAIPLKSYIQPIMIIGVIPFGMIGAMIGHFIVGIPFSALSLFGIVALAGVVVNDSIILVDSINKSVARGVDIHTAVKQAGVERFRPILLTSLTTFFGLLPVLLETSVAAQLVIPMAVSLGFGILFATVITLVLIPCLYVILDDLNLTRLTLALDAHTSATIAETHES